MPQRIFGFAATAVAATADPDDAPFLTPEKETVVRNAEFQTTCLNLFYHMAVAENVRLGRGSMSRSERWGLVWRIDFMFGNEPSPFVDRILCWRTPDGRVDIIFAFGQEIAPL